MCLGEVETATQGEDGWTFSVSRENDGEEEASFVYALAFIKSTLVNSSEEAAAVTRRLNHAVNWKLWKKRYDIMQKRIHAGTFAWPDPSSNSEPPPSHVMEAIKESFAINSPTSVVTPHRASFRRS